MKNTTDVVREHMTLRDYFAVKAMQGYFASPVTSHVVDTDAMIRAREASND